MPQELPTLFLCYVSCWVPVLALVLTLKAPPDAGSSYPRISLPLPDYPTSAVTPGRRGTLGVPSEKEPHLAAPTLLALWAPQDCFCHRDRGSPEGGSLLNGCVVSNCIGRTLPIFLLLLLLWASILNCFLLASTVVQLVFQLRKPPKATRRREDRHPDSIKMTA